MLRGFRRRYVCCGLVGISLTWAVVILVYSSHLEGVSKAAMREERNRRKAELEFSAVALGSAQRKPAKNLPFPHVDFDEKAAWDTGPKRHQPPRRQEEDYHQRQRQGDPDKVEFVDAKKLAAKAREEARMAAERARLEAQEAAPVDKEEDAGRDPAEDPAEEDAEREAEERAREEEEDGRDYDGEGDQDEADDHFKHQVPLPNKVLDLKELGAVRNKADEDLKSKGYNAYAFNGMLSDRIGERRELRDVRHPLCAAQVYASDLPKASVVICYYNEAPSALIRMLNSIFDRTPPGLLHELILVDDFSDNSGLKEAVDSYARQHWAQRPLTQLRTAKREGLIRAKIFGARKATGDVLVFLDSHCEVQQQWLEPLLARIQERPSTVVCPLIDIIDPDTFKYVEAPICMGGFNWGLFFKWDYPPESYFKTEADRIKPLRSPTMAGGLFAMNREYFHRLGEYDPGMDVWGAENVEMSFRIWMCGGELEILPCSRIGHIFRKRRPYGSPKGQDTMAKNSLRVAHVWLDDYIENFFQNRPHLRHYEYGDVSSQLALRQRLHCMSFDWYLRNVYPQLLPKDKGGVGKRSPRRPPQPQQPKVEVAAEWRIALGADEERCLQGSHQRRGRLSIVDCVDAEVWTETSLGEFRVHGLCLDASKEARMMKCDFAQSFQEWRRKGSQLFNSAAGLCLSASEGSGAVRLAVCDETEDVLFTLQDL